MTVPLQSATASAPATVANVACGFDVFGLAIREPADQVTVVRADTPGVTITGIEGDGGRLPLDAEENVAGVAARAALRRIEKGYGVELTLTKGIPLASGLGGSAASAVAAVVAVDRLFDLNLSHQEMLACALQGERVAAGYPHADNAAPSLFGGFVLISAGEHELVPRITSLPVPDGLACAIVRSHVEVNTADARDRLPEVIPLKDAVAQWGHTAGLVAGLFTVDYELIRSSLVDLIAEPARKDAVPAFDAVKQAALDAGAMGCSLSGSGPAIFALCESHDAAGTVCARMSESLTAEFGPDYDAFVSRVSPAGAHITESVPL